MTGLTAREAGEALNLEHLEVIRRIRRDEIKAEKIGGWYWIISPQEVEAVKQKQWYKNLMNLRARRSSATA